MINYKKSVLSVVAALAISSSALYSTYIPLTSDGTSPLSAAKDGVWTLFGVTAFNSRSGVAGGDAGEFSISGGAEYIAVDRTFDNAFVDGLTKSGDSLGKVKLLIDATDDYIEVRVDTSDVEFVETDPLRTIYVNDVDSNGDDTGTRLFAFTYRASLEGKTLEYSKSILGENARSITIDSKYTYRYSVAGTLTTASDADTSGQLSAIVDAVDFNLSNNPYTSTFYDKTAYGDTIEGSERFRMYRFDAENQQWEIYDMNNTSNDFTSLDIGRGYWGRMQLDPANAGTVGGMVLGKPITNKISADTYTGLKADAWNLLAFDDIYPDIRYSSTGLRLEINATTTLTLIDSSTGYEIDVSIGGTDVVADSQLINAAIIDARDGGSIAKVFDLKAFPTGTTNSSTGKEITLISNKRFGVKDSNSSGGIGYVKTLLGNKPFDLSIADVNANPVTELGDANASGAVYSVYGEYAVIIEPLIGSGTAQEHNVSSFSLMKADQTEIIVDLNTTASGENNTTNLATAINTLGIGTPTNYAAIPIDLEYESNASDLTAQYMLVAGKDPFYISDKTYIRAFTVRKDVLTDTDVNIEFKIVGGTTCSVSIDDNNTNTVDELNVTNSINQQCTSTQGRAKNVLVGSQYYVVIAGDDNRYLNVAERNSTSRLQDATSAYDEGTDTRAAYNNDDDFAKGAIGKLFTINKLAELPTSHKFTLDIDTYNIDLNDSISFELNTTQVFLGAPYADYNLTNQALTSSDYKTYFALIKQKLDTLFIDHNITATVSYNSDATDYNSSILTILADNNLNGIRIKAYEGNDGGGDQNITDTNSTLTTGIIDITNAYDELDLKTNTFLSPNYVIDGPLYTMREAGFQLRALLTGSMNYQDNTMQWDSVDLTREPSEWFNATAGDYNLFGIDHTSGYWAYLTDPDSAESDIGISNDGTKVKFSTENYHTHWDPYTGVATNHLVANFTVAIDDTIDTYDTNDSITATATIAGADIDLYQSSTGARTFASSVSSYTNPSLMDSSNEILLRLSDGLGAKTNGNVGTGLIVDLEKPAKPVISLADGAPKITTNYTEDVILHVIKVPAGESINELDWKADEYHEGISPAPTSGAGMTLENFNSLSFCTSSITTNTFKVFVVDKGSNGDGVGTIGKGNASDSDEFTYAALLYDAARFESTNDAGVLDTQSLGGDYNKSCELETSGVSFGLQLTTITDDNKVVVASSRKVVSDNTGQPFTIYVSNNSIVARLDFQEPYFGAKMYFDIAGEVWSYTLPSSEANLDLLLNTDVNPIDISVDRAAAPAHTAVQYIGLSL